MKQINVIILAILCLTTGLFSQINWTSRTPGILVSLKNVTYANNLYVAAGTGGTIRTSSDAVTWIDRISGTTTDLTGITNGNGLYIAVGNSGTILTSPDGITWTSRISGTSNNLLGTTYGNGLYIAVGNSGTILTSPDGITWTGRTSGTANNLLGVTYGNNQYVAVGNSGTILTSPDGITWTSRSGSTAYLYSVTYGNNQYVIVGYMGIVLTSPDGITWTSSTWGSSSNFTSVTYGNNLFVYVSDQGNIRTSPDGVTWTTIPGSRGTLYGITYGNNQFVIVGYNGNIVTSSDGITWTSGTSGISNDLTSVTFGNNLYVAVGNSGVIRTSSDGTTWTSRTSGTSAKLTGITYGNNRYVAVGNSGVILTSIDGITWISRTSGTTTTLYGVTYGNNQFVTVGGYPGTILTSPDGITWTSRTTGVSGPFMCVGYGNGQFLAISKGDIICVSSDGITWPVRSAATTNIMVGVTYGNNQYLAGGGGSIITSPDGITWTIVASGAITSFDCVTYNNNQFYSVGTYSNGAYGAINSSSDGVMWTNRYSSNVNLAGITYANNLFVAVGTNGIILTSIAVPNAPVLTSPANNATGVSINPVLAWGTVERASHYEVQVSTGSDFGICIINDTTPVTGTLSVSGLSNSITYFWRVRSVGAGGPSQWVSDKFTTIIAPPVAVTLTVPASNASGVAVTPTLIWTSGAGGTPDKYLVKVSTSSAFGTTVINDSTTNLTYALSTALSNSTKYYWKIAAKNENSTSAYTMDTFTTIIAAPGVVALLTPAHNATNVGITPMLTWTAGTGGTADKYIIKVSTGSSFAVTVVNDSTANLSYPITAALSNSTSYYWEVAAKNANATSSYATSSFTTVPVSPTITDADGNVYHTVIIGTQTWTVENLKTTKYNDGIPLPMVTDNTAWSNLTTPGCCWYNNDSTTYKNTYGALYNWYVVHGGKLAPAGWHIPKDAEWDTLQNYLIANGYNYDGTTTGNYIAKAMAAQTAWDTCTITGGIGNNLSTNNWSGFSALPGGYRSFNGSFYHIGNYGYWWSATESSASFAAYSRYLYYNLSGLSRGSSHKGCGFPVRLLKDSATLAAPVLTAPANGATGVPVNPTLTWGTVAAASRYLVQVSTASDFNSMVVNDTTPTTGTVSVSGLLNSTTYYWRVRSVNSGGISQWVSGNFTTMIAPPVAVTLSSPTSNAAGIGLYPKLVWSSSATAASYRVQVAASSVFTTLLVNDSINVTSDSVITALSYGTKYFWRVNAKNAGGESTWTTDSFTTLSNRIVFMSSGWSIISWNVIPNDSTAVAVFGSMSHLVIAKNSAGDVYWPAFSLNSIGTVHVGQGYQIYTTGSDTMRVIGVPVNVALSPIALGAGWNIIAYLPQTDMSIATALAGISSQITIVKNAAGEVYWPDFGINNIVTMHVGEGYYIHMKAAATLTYPSGLGKMLSVASGITLPKTRHYVYASGNTGNSATILLKNVVENTKAIPDSSEIAVYGASGALAGSGTVMSGKAAFCIWGDNVMTKEKDGLASSEALTFKVWMPTGQEFVGTYVGEISSGYAENAMMIGALSIHRPLVITHCALATAYPNPFRGNVRIAFDVATLTGKDMANVEINVYDVRGVLVRQLVNASYKTGRYSVTWDGSDHIGSNMYIVMMKTENFSRKMKLFKVK